MFRATIQSTSLNTNTANNCFSNIYGESFRGDISFLATLRALVAPRLKSGEEINLRFTQSDYTATTVSENTPLRIIHAMFDPGYYVNGSIIIHNCCNSKQTDNYACLKVAESSFCDTFKGFHRLEKVTHFFKKSFYTVCFIHPEKRKVVIFVDRLDMKKLHYLQCAIFAFLPWYFNPEDGVSADEMELIQSLRENSPEKYEECIAKIASKYDFRTEEIKRLLTGFEERFDRFELDRVKRKIQDLLHDIDNYNDRISRCLIDKNNYEIKILGLETKIAQGGSSEIMEYFLCNKKLVLYNVTDKELEFGVKDYLSYYDEDMAKRIIDNMSSYVYHPGCNCENIISKDDMKQLMYEIFINQTLKMRVCAAYRFTLGESVRGIQGYNYGHECEKYIPNAHIDSYRCLGNYERAINNCLKNHDYIGAIEQSIASCKSLNFGDGAVMKEFMKHIYGYGGYSHNKCIELPDGTVVTAKEASEWLKAQVAQEETVEEPAEDVQEIQDPDEQAIETEVLEEDEEVLEEDE